jgi:hypothetical protein
MANTKARFPRQLKQTHNSLFSPGPNGWLNACVGRNGGFPGFDRIALGYFEAGEILVKRLQQDRSQLDCLIYPLVQTYRHGIETMLKHLVLLLSRLRDESNAMRYTHYLVDNWKIVRRHLIALDVEESEFTSIDRILADLVEIDATGETFRYPRARDGSRHLEETTHINIEVFAEGMAVLKRFLEGCHCWASEMLSQKLNMDSHLAGERP